MSQALRWNSGERAIIGGLLIAALLLPWGTGAAVKIYLDSQGLPTYPWIAYINPWTLAVYVIPTTLYWSSPLLALALLWPIATRPYRLWGSSARDRAAIVLGGYMLGAVGAVRLYVPLFRDIEHSTVSAARLPLSYLPYVALGMAVGAAFALIRLRTRTAPGIPGD